MTESVNRLRAAASSAFVDSPVLFAYLFGSHAAGTATARSDIDVAVYCRPLPDLLALRLRMASVLTESSGLAGIEVVVLNGAPLALAGRVCECHVPIYCVDRAARARYESLINRRYREYKVHEERIARDLLARMAVGI
ncbi:nucleotidyltransferase domain-containing protein [Skermania sp. ID1734]|uniref:type VII toxin-antitoxin system MntA family adenylyltransferase antitoxin n=1 Tax=Skermania sp. ID1734 TaxID=2597516 RepID=UPI00163DD76D|nr:nucleotidyltransferase domain-containing protein [Skermania sp. ID1734]